MTLRNPYNYPKTTPISTLCVIFALGDIDFKFGVQVPAYTDGQLKHCVTFLITGSIAPSATRRYLSYSEDDFDVFRPAGTTRCTDGGEIFLLAKFHPHRCNG